MLRVLDQPRRLPNESAVGSAATVWRACLVYPCQHVWPGDPFQTKPGFSFVIRRTLLAMPSWRDMSTMGHSAS